MSLELRLLARLGFDLKKVLASICPRSGRVIIARHFSAGSRNKNESGAREAGDRKQIDISQICLPSASQTDRD